MIKKIRKLIDELNKASYYYYNTGNPIMEDSEFNVKMETLKEFEEKSGIIYSDSPTQNVGAPVLDKLNKINISDRPMLSLDKCHSTTDIMRFAKNQDIIASVKCDGLSVRIIYENGEIVSANTRGNGEIGQDITEHIKHFINVPLTIPTKDRLIVDGEAVILQKDFDEINAEGEFKNPRNLASGTLASLDTELCTSRRLSFIAWDIIEMKGDFQFYLGALKQIKNYGFTIVPFKEVPFTELSWIEEEDLGDVNDYILESAKEMGIPCDGVVWKYNDLLFDTTRTAKFFNNAIAFKFKDEEAETKLIDIDYDISRNGVLTPVAVFEPIELEGSIVERASLHNMSILEEILHTPYIGQPIKVYKANMIIPQISWAEDVDCPDKEINYPKFCPCCGEPTIIKESNDGTNTLQCTNENCTCRFINQLDHFCGKKGLDIKGLSRATLEKLEENGWIRCFSDIFKLETVKSEWKKLPGFGDKSVENILNAIMSARNTTLEKFICAAGIPLIGSTISKEIAKRTCGDYDNFRRLVDNSEFRFDEWNGFGYEMNKSLKSFDYSELDNIVENYITFEKFIAETTGEKLKGVTICITGKLSKKRDDIKTDIENAGGKVTGTVSGKTNYLVCNAPENTAKYNKAIELNIPIITEKELMEMLNG